MPTRRARLRRKIYAKLPNWLKTHDFEVFAAMLGILAGLPLALGQVRPTSVESLLPRGVVVTWGTVLVLGCMCIFLGLIMSARKVYPERIFWMRLEALGLTAIAYFCYIYVICLLITSFDNTWSASMIILAFGGTCHVREVSINLELEQYRLTLGLGERA